MGRPKKMRTPEERCAAKREYDRRRRADPAQRAKEAAAKRRRRAEDPEYARRERARERQRKRAVREADPGFRAAENEQRRARREQEEPAEVFCGGRTCWSQAAQAVIATAARGSQCNQRLVTRAIACQTDHPPDGVDGPVGAPVAPRQAGWSSSCCSHLDGRGPDLGANDEEGGGGVAVHRCGACRKCFGYKDSLLRHMLSPSCCKPFVCGRCHRGFAHQGDLAEHERLRTGCRLYECRVCGQDFAHSCNLVRHEVRFHWDTTCRRVCRVCGQSFVRREQLEEHERSHSSHKPYACGVCGKSYTVRWSLVRHERKHRAQELGAAAHSVGAQASPPSEEPVTQGQVTTGHEVPAQTTTDLPNISAPCVMLVTLGLGPISP